MFRDIVPGEMIVVQNQEMSVTRLQVVSIVKALEPRHGLCACHRQIPARRRVSRLSLASLLPQTQRTTIIFIISISFLFLYSLHILGLGQPTRDTAMPRTLRAYRTGAALFLQSLVLPFVQAQDNPFDCKVSLDGGKLQYDLTSLEGVHTLFRTRDIPPTRMVDEVQFNLCNDLQKREGVAEGDQVSN